MFESERDQLQEQLDRITIDLDAYRLVKRDMEHKATEIRPGYPEADLPRMSVEDAMQAIAVADEHGILDTSDAVPILIKAKHISEDHEKPARRLSGILGASERFERIGPGKFRLVAKAMPQSGIPSVDGVETPVLSEQTPATPSPQGIVRPLFGTSLENMVGKG